MAIKDIKGFASNFENTIYLLSYPQSRLNLIFALIFCLAIGFINKSCKYFVQDSLIYTVVLLSPSVKKN